MNPEIDLSQFRKSRDGRDPLAIATPLATTDRLVSPPVRVFTRYVVPLCLFAGFVGVGGFALRDSLVTTTDVRIVLPVPASTSAAPTDAGESTVPGAPLFQAPGWIEPYPFQRVISALTPGIVRRLNVLEGQQVSSGTVIAELVDEDARMALKVAEAELKVREVQLEAAENSHNNPLALKEIVKTTQVDIERLQAEKNRNQQTVLIAQREMEINRTLATRGAQAEILAQKASHEKRAAELAVNETEAKIRSAHATLEFSEEKLRLLVEEKNRVLIARADVEKARAAVEDARYRLAQRQVVAETSATLMSLFVGEGATLSMDSGNGLRIASVYDPAQLQVRADVPIAQVSKLQIGQPVEIKVDVLPDQTFHGEVTRIVQEADLQKNTLPVKVRITDPDPALKPEMIARLEFSSIAGSPRAISQQVSETSGTGVLIPSKLVPLDAKNADLWVIASDRTAHRRKVELGRKSSGDLRHVVSGISLPDKIIASNTDKLKEGGRIKIVGVEEQ